MITIVPLTPNNIRTTSTSSARGRGDGGVTPLFVENEDYAASEYNEDGVVLKFDSDEDIDLPDDARPEPSRLKGYAMLDKQEKAGLERVWEVLREAVQDAIAARVPAKEYEELSQFDYKVRLLLFFSV